MSSILCDSSSLITLVDSCYLDMFYYLNRKYKIDFIIPPYVREEIIEKPLSIKMRAYELSALRMKEAINDNVFIEVDAQTKEETDDLLKIANNIFFVRGKPIHLIDKGETDMLVLASKLNIDTLLIDERTTRLLIEAPFKLKEHLEKELNVNVMMDKKNYDKFKELVKGMKIIRSVEILLLSYELGYFNNINIDKRNIVNASLYKLKYNGCAISFDEIEQIIHHELK